MSDFSKLFPWGWNARWEHALALSPGQVPARVIGREGPLYCLETPEGARWGHTSGRFRYDADLIDLPLVGDWVAVNLSDATQAVIHDVYPRQTLFSRAVTQGQMQVNSPLAANLDVLGIVTGLDGNFNPRRAQRLATLARQGGILPLWILSKADLPGAAEKVVLARKVAGTDPVIALSPLTGEGVAELEPWLRPGLTVALAGSSGVGKTTLVNWLRRTEPEQPELATGGVREDDSKGRHTTTSRHLYRLDGGALLMDAPGFRTVGLWADEEALEESFADIACLAAECRFDDCQHGNEPGCAVRAALESGELGLDRWKSWQKQLREVRHLERQGDVLAQRKERDRWKAIHQSMRGFNKSTRAGGA